jgi:hypothetical protein
MNREELSEGGGAEGAEAGGPAPAPPASGLNPLDLAVSVTRQVQISGPNNWTHLVTGIDTLDLGYYIDWGNNWTVLAKALADGKQSAESSQGVIFNFGTIQSCLILPGGKQPMYRYHLQTANFHVFIAHRQDASEKYPNVYVSILAKSLWIKGIPASASVVEAFVVALGGKIGRVQVSRADFCADFLIPGGLSLDFLNEFRVCRSPHHRHYMNGDKLETYYIGAGGAPIQARIYDKALEVRSEGIKMWFPEDVWKIRDCQDVWRPEFQVRREALKEFGIETLNDLAQRGRGIWEHLTDAWLSLRIPDNENVTRRTVHPWWSAVQEVGDDLGPAFEITRNRNSGGQAISEWYVAHGSGCLVGFAAREGFKDFDTAVAFL